MHPLLSSGRRHVRSRAAILLALFAAVPLARADGPYRDPDNPNPKDPWEGTYPIPYHRLAVPEIVSDLDRVRAYLESAVPMRIVDGVADRGVNGDFNNLDYTMGVVHAGMLLAARETGDRRFTDFTAARLQFIADSLPFFREQAARSGVQRNSFRQILAPAALDDCGAMTAALIKARLAGIGPDLSGVISSWSEYIAHGQFRLPDGTLARRRPQAVSLWADDFYMGIPALGPDGENDR